MTFTTMFKNNLNTMHSCKLWIMILMIHHVHPEKIVKVDYSLMDAVVTKEMYWTHSHQIEFLPRPEITQNQVLVEVKAAGINCFDVYIKGEKLPNSPKMPKILGKEIAGIISDTNTTIPIYKKGDPVFCGIESGGYATYAAAHVSDCYPLSSKLTFTQGAALYVTYFTACRALIVKAKLKKGETVLIHGTDGESGVAAIQIAKAAGAYVVATVESYYFEELAKEAGADCTVNERGEDYINQATNKLNGSNFDVIYTLRYNTDMLKEKLYLNPNGRIVFQKKDGPYGSWMVPSTTPDQPSVVENEDAKTSMNELSGHHASNHTEYTDSEGKIMFSVSQLEYTAVEQKEAAEFVLKAIEDNFVKPVIPREYRFTEIELTQKVVSAPEPKKGKLVFVT